MLLWKSQKHQCIAFISSSIWLCLQKQNLFVWIFSSSLSCHFVEVMTHNCFCLCTFLYTSMKTMRHQCGKIYFILSLSFIWISDSKFNTKKSLSCYTFSFYTHKHIFLLVTICLCFSVFHHFPAFLFSLLHSCSPCAGKRTEHLFSTCSSSEFCWPGCTLSPSHLS